MPSVVVMRTGTAEAERVQGKRGGEAPDARVHGPRADALDEIDEPVSPVDVDACLAVRFSRSCPRLLSSSCSTGASRTGTGYAAAETGVAVDLRAS